MSVDLERWLSLVAASEPHADLEGLEACVLERLRERRQNSLATGVTLSFAAVSLLMGVAGSVLPTTRAQAASSAPFGIPSALAPSSLLLSGRE